MLSASGVAFPVTSWTRLGLCFKTSLGAQPPDAVPPRFPD